MSVVLAASMCLAAASCESIYEDESDCSAKIKFVFKKHRQALHAAYGKAADVFDSTVESVHLFIYDAQSGELVFEKSEMTANLKSETELKLGTGTDKCYMTVDLTPGNYRLVAWCGLGNDNRNNAFSLGGESTRTQYSECSVTIDESTGNPVNDEKYDCLYHGAATATVDFNTAAVIPVELTKNNNDIAVWVQHTSALFGPGDYEVVYTDANGSMKFEDNSLTRNDMLEYHPHTTSLLATETVFNGDTVEAGALVAHISTSRLTEANQNTAKLEVRNRQGETLFSVPFIKYLLEMQDLTRDGQYYLDCEDTFNCSFYLSGDNGLWMPARIIINNWVKVPDQNDTIGEK